MVVEAKVLRGKQEQAGERALLGIGLVNPHKSNYYVNHLFPSVLNDTAPESGWYCQHPQSHNTMGSTSSKSSRKDAAGIQ